jgi:hypothetical protein
LESWGEGGETGDLGDGVVGEQAAHEGLEVFHVWTGDDGATGHEGFDWVLAAVGEETFPDDGDIGERLPSAQFAGGIDEQHIGCGAGVPVGAGGFRQGGSARDVEAERGELGFDVWGAFHVAWGDEQPQRRRGEAQGEKRFGESDLFTGVGTGGQQKRGERSAPELGEQGGELGAEWFLGGVFVIVFQAPGDGDDLWAHADGRPADDVLWIGHEDLVEGGEKRGDEAPGGEVSSF